MMSLLLEVGKIVKLIELPRLRKRSEIPARQIAVIEYAMTQLMGQGETAAVHIAWRLAEEA
jgi:hypothetical protein